MKRNKVNDMVRGYVIVSMWEQRHTKTTGVDIGLYSI